MNRATRIYASALGMIIGLTGLEHGILEFLQGNVRPNGIMIDAIGPEQKLWELATEPALTVIPSFLISGILSMLIGLLITIWAYSFVESKYGAIVFVFLSIALFLVGGGFAPILIAVLAFIAATQVPKPLRFWRSRIPANLRNLVAKLWPWTLIFSVISVVISVQIAIFGEPLSVLVGAKTAYSIQVTLGMAMLILAILAFPTANAHDTRSKNESSD